MGFRGAGFNEWCQGKVGTIACCEDNAVNIIQHCTIIKFDRLSTNKSLDTMQTRQELYDRINYHQFEQYLDASFAKNK